MKFLYSKDQELGCVVIYDTNFDIKLIIPNGKTKITKIGDECEHCFNKDIEFAKTVVEILNSRK